MPSDYKVNILLSEIQNHVWSQFYDVVSAYFSERTLKPEVRELVDKIIANPDDVESMKLLSRIHPRLHSFILGVRAAVDAIVMKFDATKVVSSVTVTPKMIERNKKATKVGSRLSTERTHQHYAVMAHRLVELVDGLGFTQRDAADVLTREGYRTQRGQSVRQLHISRHLQFCREFVASNPQNRLF